MKPILFLLTAICGVSALSLWAQTPGKAADKALPVEKLRAGGPCKYSEYAGTATITRVEQTERSRRQAKNVGGAGYEGYEVWFRFTPASEIREEWARPAAGREHPFTLMNSWYPGPHYIQKYDIKPGLECRCVMKVITKGTCTPIMFDFPGIRRDDYFESPASRKP
jgi:hypothetical protein